MKIALIPPTHLSIRMTDEEALALAESLQALVLRRKALIGVEPGMASWNDAAASFAAELDDKPFACSFSICST